MFCFIPNRSILLHACATFSELTSNILTMIGIDFESANLSRGFLFLRIEQETLKRSNRQIPGLYNLFSSSLKKRKS